jgi:Glycosyl transferases group 1/Glycosyltransferase Family 4
MPPDRPATKVAIIRPYAALPSENGSNDRYVNLARRLIAQGAKVELICSDFIHNAKKHRNPSEIIFNLQKFPFLVQIHALAYSGNLSPARIAHEILFGFSALIHLLSKPKPDVVVVGEPLFGVGWIMLAYGFLFRVPVIGDVIDLWPEADTASHGGLVGSVKNAIYEILRKSRQLRLGCYRAVSFVSRSYAERLMPHAFDAPVFYWGSELTRNNPYAPSNGPLTAIYAGSFGVGYDIASVLDAARKIRAEMPGRFRILIAGSGPQRDEVERAHAAGEVEYLGMLDQARLTEVYEQADIGLLPYKAGSMVAMPIKFYDYINFGLFTLISLDMEAADIVRKNGIGAAYKAGDAGNLVQQLKATGADYEAPRRAREICAGLAMEFSVTTQYDRFARFVLDHARTTH